MTAWVVIHGLSDALAAIEGARSENKTLDLITAPGASSYLGAGMFKIIVDDLRSRGFAGAIYYDCGAARGDAMAALRAGLTQLCLEPNATNPAIQDLAKQYGATLISRPAECFEYMAAWLRS